MCTLFFPAEYIFFCMSFSMNDALCLCGSSKARDQRGGATGEGSQVPAAREVQGWQRYPQAGPGAGG